MQMYIYITNTNFNSKMSSFFVTKRVEKRERERECNALKNVRNMAAEANPTSPLQNDDLICDSLDSRMKLKF